MTEVYRRQPAPPDWPRPEGITTREIDKTTGELANAYCSADSVVTEYFIAGTEPVQECSPFNMGQPLDSTARPGVPNVANPPKPPPGKRDTTTNPFKIP